MSDDPEHFFTAWRAVFGDNYVHVHVLLTWYIDIELGVMHSRSMLGN